MPINADEPTEKRGEDHLKNLWFLIQKTYGFQKAKALKLKLKLKLYLNLYLEHPPIPPKRGSGSDSFLQR